MRREGATPPWARNAPRTGVGEEAVFTTERTVDSSVLNGARCSCDIETKSIDRSLRKLIGVAERAVLSTNEMRELRALCNLTFRTHLGQRFGER